MLEQALRVVEAARGLKLERRGKVSGSAISDKLALAVAIDGLREAIDVFDKETSQGLGTPGYVARPDFATPPQLDERGFIEKQEMIEAQTMSPGIEPVFVNTPEIAPEDVPDVVPSMTFAPTLSIPAASHAAGMEYLNKADLGDMEFNDGTESVADFLECLDAISDKLNHVVAKIGWTPRLRGLAEAANVAKRKMFLDVAHDGYYIRVPAQSWSTLTVAIADAVTARDNKLTIPVPTPKPRPELEDDLNYRYGPKPPGYVY